jgi:tetratricopeptide (TPR) repeat protein
MAKSLKYSLSFFALIVFGNCKEPDKFKEYSLSDRKRMSVEYLENGEKNFRQGSPENMELIEIAIKLDSNNSAAWRELSVPYLKRGMPHEWKPLFDKAVEIDPIAWQGWRGYLKLFFYRDYKSAIDDFNATDTLTTNFTDYPQSMSVDYLRGLAYLQLDDKEKALDYFTKYIDEVTAKSGENWVDVDAFIHRAIVLIKLREFEKAKLDLEKCLKYYSSSSDAYFHLSVINYHLDKREIAKEQIMEAKRLFKKGYYMHRPYVETFGQIEISDIEEIERELSE